MPCWQKRRWTSQMWRMMGMKGRDSWCIKTRNWDWLTLSINIFEVTITIIITITPIIIINIWSLASRRSSSPRWRHRWSRRWWWWSLKKHCSSFPHGRKAGANYDYIMIMRKAWWSLRKHDNHEGTCHISLMSFPQFPSWEESRWKLWSTRWRLTWWGCITD